ncbi:MAG: DUF4340 domain-containing protein [Magnetococcales bacterium]|nr:DUF4340 domain-containing protein [Magnetococcales bacterium]
MSKGWRNNLILAAIMAAAAGGLWTLDARESARDEADKLSRSVSTLRADGATSAEFRDGAGQSVTLTREGDRWAITGPSRLRTNGEAVKGMLEVLGRNYEKKAVDSLTDPAPFGLTAPAARLLVKDDKGASTVLLVGSTTPANPQKRYASLGEKGPVVLMANNDLAKVMQPVNDLRDKRLARTESTDLTRIVLKKQTGESIRLVREQEGVWNLEAPLKDRADANRINAWIFALTGSQGTAFQKDKPEGEGAWTVELTPSKGDNETFTIWRVGETLLASRAGEPDWMMLPKYLVEELDKSALELVAMRPVESKSDFDTLRLESEGKTLSAEKKSGQWPRDEWGSIEEMLLRDAYRGVPLKTDGTPLVTITLGQGDKARVLRVYQEKKTVIVTLPDRPISLELTPLQAESLQKAVGTLLPPPSAS